MNSRTVRRAASTSAEPNRNMSSAGGPDQRAGAGAVGLGDQAASPADDRHRDPGRLALDQVGGRRELVGHRGDRHLQRRAERVRLAAVVAQRQPARPRRSPRRSGRSATGRPIVSVIEHRHGDAQPVAQPLAQPPGGAVGVLGQQRHRARRRCWSRPPRRRRAPGRAGSPRCGPGRAGPPPGPSPRRWRSPGRPG